MNPSSRPVGPSLFTLLALGLGALGLGALGPSACASSGASTTVHEAHRGAAEENSTAPLSSWNDGPSKSSIIQFVESVSTVSSPTFVPEAERIAVFDNDGTLWAEQPIYSQLQFAFDRIRILASEHPEWKDTQPFKAVLENDLKAVAASGMSGLLEIVAASHANVSAQEFSKVVEDWLASARHPKTQRPYTDMVYAPMLELLAYLRAHGFKTYISSGGGVEFMRPWVERVYGIPPEQVIGSEMKAVLEMQDGVPTLMRRPEIRVINDKEEKPVGIDRRIGRRPIAAFGNSDGDLAMLQWTTAGDGPRFGLLIHHTDADREWAYDKESHVGRLDKALTEAQSKGWTVVDMKRDWKTVFPR